MLAVIGAVVGELLGARVGIGVLILEVNFALDLATVFALLIVLSATGGWRSRDAHREHAPITKVWSGRERLRRCRYVICGDGTEEAALAEEHT